MGCVAPPTSIYREPFPATVAERPIVEPEHRPVAEAAAELGLCDHCLGRTLARVDHGLGNDERGQLLAEAWDLDVVEPDACYVCEGLFDRLEQMTDVVEAALEDLEFATYLVGTRVDPGIEEREAQVFEACGTEDPGKITTELNREIGRRLWERHGWDAEFQRPEVTAVLDTRFDHVTLTYRSLCIFGRYRKLVRDIPQTFWPCRACRGTGCYECDKTGLRYQISVEQLVSPPAREAAGATESKFHGAGREDVDALCLGTGRPFVIELVDPQRRSLDLEKLREAIDAYADGKVEVDSLRFVDPDAIPLVKEARGDKVYEADVTFEDPVPEETVLKACRMLTDARVAQRTPSRVSHRRADKVRHRNVARLELRSHDGSGKTARLLVEGDAGLYIKELISGDDGRTEPSVAEIVGTEATCTALDVVSVEGPPEIEDDSATTE